MTRRVVAVALLAMIPTVASIPPAEAHRRSRSARSVPRSARPAVPPPADIAEAVCSAFGDDCAEALDVARCESRFRPDARNGVHVGLFQLSGRWHRARAARLGYEWERMTEAGPNAVVAADLHDEQGWRPWSCQP